MIVKGADGCGAKPWGSRGGVDMAASIGVGCSFIEGHNQKGVGPVWTGGDQWHESLEEGVTLSNGAVMHVVSHVRHYKGEVDGWIEVRQRLNVGALGRIKLNASKTDRGIMFADVLSRNTGTVDPACE